MPEHSELERLSLFFGSDLNTVGSENLKTLEEVYNAFKDEDCFLYASYKLVIFERP